MFLIIFWGLCAIATSAIAVEKGRDGLAYFMVGCLMGPLAVLIVGLSPAVDTEERHRAKGEQKCPECLGWVPLRAGRCMHCGSWLDPQPEPMQ